MMIENQVVEPPIPILLEIKQSWDNSENNFTSIVIHGQVVSASGNDLFIKTVPFRPKNSPAFIRTLLVFPIHAQDAEKGLLELAKKPKPVQCGAVIYRDGNPVKPTDLGYRGNPTVPEESFETTLCSDSKSKVA